MYLVDCCRGPQAVLCPGCFFAALLCYFRGGLCCKQEPRWTQKPRFTPCLLTIFGSGYYSTVCPLLCSVLHYVYPPVRAEKRREDSFSLAGIFVTLGVLWDEKHPMDFIPGDPTGPVWSQGRIPWNYGMDLIPWISCEISRKICDLV